MQKTLILYLFKEDEKTAKNLKFFIENGVHDSPEIDYVFIINDYKCSLTFPDLNNIRIHKKANSYDLSSYMIALQESGYKHYRHFIFINSSCIGPFLPTYHKNSWHRTFTDLLNEKVKLVSPIVEIPKDNYGSLALKEHKYITAADKSVPFLHTYMFATDIIGLEMIFKYGAFNDLQISRHDLIHTYERLITSSILNEGFEIKSLLYRFKNIDLTDKKFWDYKMWAKNHRTCPEIPHNYDGIDVQPLELVFIKNIRNRHVFRSWRASGISMSLKKIINRYVSWT